MTQQQYPGRHHLNPSQQQQPQPLHPVAEPQGLPASVRGRALDRAMQVNASHARNAADRIGTRDALGEHALVLFSVDETARPFRLSVATRLDYEEHRGENLPALLQALGQHAWNQIQAAYRTGKRWDPRTPMDGLVLRSDPVTPETEYIGLAISTLDTPTAPWHDLKRSVSSADGLNLSGQGYLYLRDGTAMYFLRAAQTGSGAGQHTIVTNRAVHSIYRPRMDNELPGDPQVWQGLEKLHHVLMSA
ncbi:hypothetical protein [Actinoplanes sp. N902-109]|uniref:hypothetical protein n=1 Tax=Actinoplanes sp. (strain N902-109) TaxID=649831 RepID=UPI0003295A72|nr:hypothetical protein [Actinoplanes sp. N902-109]AGL13789.1 hypothetical protein L083_0279 [Actinoplanes sp. N902-109]